MISRCSWCTDDPLYIAYHDHEWGVPVYDDTRLFEFLLLEGAQAGLSWITVLKKREGYRRLFAEFDPAKVAGFSDQQLEERLLDPSIIRNRLKVFGARTNAKAFLSVQAHYGSFSEFLWSYTQSRPLQNTWADSSEVPATTPLSDKISKDLKKLGFTFVGSTIIYAYLQAIGMVNDHTLNCFRHQACRQLSLK
ncbi:DNA-3-methyladenine glycosylase I [Parahaliea sp. F7430]|uniref:DNA-3-methyladenine glycosylase I n=1 Tax=Sediminihaliea albiluteola TaxID=2758564 RepID=A0A7W2YLB4_9GAMM|nr:DNA-3-methyladenine glycosylase I [Sediminihaliea albiluteola]MBA6414228.1 DNA-3-methyladenine glycosylase I [Sediminihaliea albiluteola]